MLATSIVQKSCRVNRRVGRNNNGRSTSEPTQNRRATFVDTLISRRAILANRSAVPHNDPANAKATTVATRQPERVDSFSRSFLAIPSLGKDPQCFPRASTPQDSDLNATNLLVVDEKVRREKALDFSGCNSRPGTGSFHPVAIEAAAEATKLSELSMERVV